MGSRNRVAKKRRHEVCARLGELSEHLHPLFPNMAAEHYLEAAEGLVAHGKAADAVPFAAKARALAEVSCRMGEHLWDRIYSAEAACGL